MPSSDFNADFNADFGGTGVLPGAGFISLLHIVGNTAYGLVASTLNAGHDEPFAVDLLANAFIPVTGITAANTPLSPATAGAWTPPTSDVIGSKLVVTHPGFTGIAGVFFGWFDISNPDAPVWNGGNLTGLVTFTFPPSAVKQFNGRAYYIENITQQPAVIFSDSLNPTVVTNANQVLTFGDVVPLTALGALPLQNQLGGIIQGLMVFKGVQNIYQITGDSAFGTLSINALNTATGTLAPNTVCSTPKGLAFVAPDGVRIIDQYARVGDPIGIDGSGMTIPFIYSNVPSRMVAACTGTVLRITTQNADVANTPFQEWWYDITRQIWHGPHTFAASLIAAWNNTFIVAPVGVLGALFQSDTVQSDTSTYVENGRQLQWVAASPMLPDLDQMTINVMTETTWHIALSSSIPAITVQAQTQNGTVLDTISITAPVSGTIWGAFTWGQAVWSGAPNALAPRDINWHLPIVFNRLALVASGQSTQDVKIGTLRMRYQVTRQLQNTSAVIS